MICGWLCEARFVTTFQYIGVVAFLDWLWSIEVGWLFYLICFEGCFVGRLALQLQMSSIMKMLIYALARLVCHY